MDLVRKIKEDKTSGIYLLSFKKNESYKKKEA